MKKLVKKLAVASATLAMLTGLVGIIPASATVVSNSTTASAEGKTFNSSWETPIVLDIVIDSDTTIEASLSIGFDTWWTDEDYVTKCWAPTGWKHKASVENDWYYEETSTSKGGFNTGKVDIVHVGDYVCYTAYVNIG